MDANTINEAIVLLQQLPQLQQLQEQLDRKKAYTREYMKKKWATDPVFRDRHRAYSHGLTYEEYIAKKEAGEIRRGRPKKVIATA